MRPSVAASFSWLIRAAPLWSIWAVLIQIKMQLLFLIFNQSFITIVWSVVTEVCNNITGVQILLLYTYDFN